ncbi:MAG: serine hydrolase domain-containing protein [Chitinophagaceae bacterium]
MKKFLFIALLLGSGFYGFAQTFSLIADSIRKYRSVPGLVYAVFTHDKIVDTSCSGMRVFRSRENIRYNDHFYVGSNSSMFTSFIAARIVESGKIQWNSSLISVLPELNGKIIKLYHRITLQQLLFQCGGIPEYPADSDYLKLNLQLTGKNITEQRKNLVQLALKRTPLLMLDSSMATYSPASIIVATAMLEKVTGKSWEELVELYINKPLNTHAATVQSRIPDSLQATGHSYRSGSLIVETQNPAERQVIAAAPATGIDITLRDYIVFLQELMKGLQNKKALINNTSAEKMLFGLPGHAMGWENETWRNLNISYALGKDAFFSCYVEIIKEKNIAIVVLCNSGPSNGRSVALNFAQLMRNYYTR